MPSSTATGTATKAKGASARRGGTLLRRLATLPALRQSFNSLRRRKGKKGGIDDVSIEQFHDSLETYLRAIKERLRKGTYRFSALRPAAIPKPDGKYRPILVPTVEDRVVQRAILNSIQKYIEPEVNHPNSHAYVGGSGRGVRSAVIQLCESLKLGANCVLLVDIVEFFPSVDAALAIADLEALLPDRSLKPLLTQLQAWEVGDLGSLPEAKQRCFPLSGKGLPQGSVLSPTLANLYLRNFDRTAVARGLTVIRYADDLAVPCSSEAEARTAHSWIKSDLSTIGLTVHDLPSKKSRIVSRPLRGIDFLGVLIKGTPRRLVRRPSQSAVANAKNVIADTLDPRSRAPLAVRYRKLSYFLSSWLATFRQVADVSRARVDLIQATQTGLIALLKANGFITDRATLSNKQRLLLGVDSLFR